MLAPETNGEVAVKAWEALSKITGREHAHLALHEGGREDPLPRHPGATAQDHQLAHVVGHRERERELQRGLDQRPRADPLAHAHRPPAVLPGPQVDAGLRRGPVRLPPAGRPEDHRADAGRQAQRQPGDGAQLHHAAPEVGHPLDLHRQPDDAHALARRADHLALRGRREARRHRGQRLDRGLQRQRRDRRAGGGVAAGEARACASCTTRRRRS